MPAREDVLGWLTAVHQDSRMLKRLPAVRHWPAQLTADWTSACKAFNPSLAAALHGGDELALM